MQLHPELLKNTDTALCCYVRAATQLILNHALTRLGISVYDSFF